MDLLAFAVGMRSALYQCGQVARGLLAIHTPTIGIDDTLRETFHITATSVVSPNVWAHAVSFAVPPGYQLNEGESGFSLHLPLAIKRFP